jgi:hypothetical protein
VAAADTFSHRLIELHGNVGGGFLAIAYFDEAHTMRNVREDANQSKGGNAYFALMHVLSTLESAPIFFIFLSTNSSLSTLAPPDAHYPSLRVRQGWKLIPPFFELPFDNFCCGFTKELEERGELTLKGVCELEQIVKFGRPM